MVIKQGYIQQDRQWKPGELWDYLYFNIVEPILIRELLPIIAQQQIKDKQDAKKS